MGTKPNLQRGSRPAIAGALAGALKGAGACIHLATGSGDTWEAVERAMVKGSVAVARACRDAGIGRFA